MGGSKTISNVIRVIYAQPSPSPNSQNAPVHACVKKIESVKLLESVNSYGPTQVVEFHNDSATDTRDQQARRAYELVREFLSEVVGEQEA